MNYTDIPNIFLAVAAITVGAFLGGLCNKLIILNDKNRLHYFLYGFALLVFFFSVVSIIIFWRKLFFPSWQWFELTVIFISAIGSVVLFWFTKRYLTVNQIFLTPELDPIVNKFTKSADKNEIRLFAGDLNFFGNFPREMDNNAQYTCLRSEGFKRVSILCSEPKQPEDKLRYGKILYDFPAASIKFYNPEKPDLLLRGRMKELQGVTRLLIYQKIASGRYKAIETDTANSHGALFNNLWQLLWTIARQPTDLEINEYKNFFIGKLQ